MRLWFYWIHENYSKGIFRGELHFRVVLTYLKVKVKERIGEMFDIESPDMERFDFLIDTKKKKVLWMGT